MVPALVAQVNAHLDRLGSTPVIGLDIWGGSGRLLLTRELDGRLLARLCDTVRQGHPLPAKLLHSLEALGPVVGGTRFVHPCTGQSAARLPRLRPGWMLVATQIIHRWAT